jgi:hypothetical protein
VGTRLTIKRVENMTYPMKVLLIFNTTKPESNLGYDSEIVPSISHPHNPISIKCLHRTFLCEGLFALCSFPKQQQLLSIHNLKVEEMGCRHGEKWHLITFNSQQGVAHGERCISSSEVCVCIFPVVCPTQMLHPLPTVGFLLFCAINVLWFMMLSASEPVYHQMVGKR